METKIIAKKNPVTGKPELLIVNMDLLQHRARLAEQLIEKWGLVAGMPDGEDAAGRAKLRLATPGEMVTRACETADLAYAEFKKKRWLLRVPELPIDTSGNKAVLR